MQPAETVTLPLGRRMQNSIDACAAICAVRKSKKAPDRSEASAMLVGREGFEPSTKRLKVFCSTD
jgi:hypothetical protein